jgi:hypothetical protein
MELCRAAVLKRTPTFSKAIVDRAGRREKRR